MTRADGRLADELRKVKITRNYLKYAEGSVLVEFGDTKVICAATVEERVPPFLKGSGEGWVSAEYSLLPRSTQSRNIREAAKGKQTGRTHEIQRLIGRALRSVIDLKALGEKPSGWIVMLFRLTAVHALPRLPAHLSRWLTQSTTFGVTAPSRFRLKTFWPQSVWGFCRKGFISTYAIAKIPRRLLI